MDESQPATIQLKTNKNKTTPKTNKHNNKNNNNNKTKKQTKNEINRFQIKWYIEIYEHKKKSLFQVWLQGS